MLNQEPLRYGLTVSYSSLCVEVLTPSVAIFEDGASKKVIKTK